MLNAVSGKPTNDKSKATLFYFLKGTEDGYSNAEYVFEEKKED